MLQSRKMISVKSIVDDNSVFVRGVIRKSFCKDTHSAVLMFICGKPKKGCCDCVIGRSGLCCHVLCLLLFLKHFHDNNEELFELTVTQQLQKWHRRSGNGGSIPMMPLAEINVTSAKLKKGKDGKINIKTSNDTINNNNPNKRNVSKIIDSVNKQLDLEVSVEKHTYKVLMQHEVGRKSSVGQHLPVTPVTNHMSFDGYIHEVMLKIV